MALDTSRLGDANLRNSVAQLHKKVAELEARSEAYLQLAIDLADVVKAMAEKGKDKDLVARMEALIPTPEPEGSDEENKE